MNLYDICSALANLEFIDMETGEVNLEMLDGLEMKYDEKVENIACFVKNLNSEASAIEAEEKSLRERRVAKKNKVEALTQYLDSMMKLVGKNSYESARTKISYRKSTSTDVQEEDFIKWAKDAGRMDLLRIKPLEVNKTAIKEALKDEEIPFVDIVENYNIQIK